MKILKLIITLIMICIISACSSKNPAIVSDLVALQIPVVPPSAYDANTNNSAVKDLYLSNEKIIFNLTSMLKERYLTDTKKKDMFDTHSLSHQVYVALTKLEEAGMVNHQYFDDKNVAGLHKLNEKLVPYTNKI